MSKYYKAEDVDYIVRMKYAEEENEDREEVTSEICRLIFDLPTIEVSEDCISREWVLREFENDRENISKSEYFDELAWLITHAPSVVPTTEQSSMVGEWIKQGQGRYRRCVCSVCGYGNGRKYNDNFCSNCGAKMKGADDEQRT